jgi:DNA invertase Pin-like site-specific DNA recombinase
MVKCNADQVRRLQRALKREKNPKIRQRIQMVLLRESGMTQPEIADATGVSLSTVNRTTDDLAIPANITLEFLPPCSPELNPQENI